MSVLATIGSSITVADLEVPEGVTIVSDSTTTVAQVTAQVEEKEEEVFAGEATDEEEGEEGEIAEEASEE